MVWRLIGVFLFLILFLSACADNSSGGSASRLPDITVPETTSAAVAESVPDLNVESVGVIDNSPEVNAERFMVSQLKALGSPTTELDLDQLNEIAVSELVTEVVKNISALAKSESFFEDPDGSQLLVSQVNLPLIQGDPSEFIGYREGEVATVEMCWDDNSKRLSLDGEVIEAFDRTAGLLLTLVMQDESWKVASVDYEDAEVLDNCV